jgi:ceramide glucosyltransferase
MLYALLALAVFGLITSTVFAAMVVSAVPGYLQERRAAFAKLDHPPGFTPALSLLKPLHGAEPGLEKDLATFFEQDYPQYEILFCARTEGDAGLETARRVAARYPEIAVRFLSTGEPPYINAKVRSMELMETEAAHDILVISDSDVRVASGYLRSVALPFANAGVGAITCPYRGVAAERGLWARLEAVGMSVEMTAGVLVARMMEGMQFTLGPTMAFRRETIRRMGGFAVTADYCADDFVLGNETFKLGQTVVLSHHTIDHISRPKGHFGTALTFSMPFGLLGLGAGIAMHQVGLGVGLLAWAVASRLVLSVAVGNWVVGDRSWFGLLVLYPIRDLMGFGFWAASYLSNKILWRGRVFELLPGGKMRAAE